MVTAALMLSVYAIVGGNEAGWTSTRTLVLLGAGVALLAAFVAREARVANPLVPLRLFALRNVSISQVVGALWAAAMFAWFFLAAIYLQKVLDYSALEVGLAFVPTSVVMAYCSLRVSDKLVMRFGIRPPLTVGLLLAAVSLALFSQAPSAAASWPTCCPRWCCSASAPASRSTRCCSPRWATWSRRSPGSPRAWSNTSFMMGGALGLAVLVSISTARTESLAADGASTVEALNGGLQAAFAVGAVAALLAAVVGGVFLRPKPMTGMDRSPTKSWPRSPARPSGRACR